MANLKMFCFRWATAIKAHWPFYLCLLALALLCRELWSEWPRNLDKVLASIKSAHEAGDMAKVEEYAQAWLPRLGRAFFFVCLALIFCGPWIIGWKRDSKCSPEGPRSESGGKALWKLTVLMMACSAVLNYPRLFQSFWFDEECTVRRFVVGEFRDSAKVPPEFREPTWRKTLFSYRDPNNHPLLSVLARLGHQAFPSPKATQEFHFREWPIRLPGYLFGIAGLAAVAWLSSVMGMRRVGMIAVVWLVFHPWQVRYGVDARGYSLLLTFLPLCMGCLWRAVRTGSMNWWLAYGLSEFLVLWSYPGALYFVMSLNVVATGMMVQIRPAEITRSLQWRRFISANALGAMLTTLALAPCVQSMLIYLKSGRIRGVLTGEWVAEAASGVFTGMPWADWDEHEMALSWMRIWAHTPWLVVAVLASLLALTVTGAAALWRRGVQHRWLVGQILLLGPFMFFMARVQGNILYPWYLVLCLPGLSLVVGSGMEALTRRVPSAWALSGGLIIWLAATWPQVNQLRSHPIEPMRESVELMRVEKNARTANLAPVLTASLSFPARLYDPAATQVETVAELKSLMVRADKEHLPLYVNFADKAFLKVRNPEMIELLDKSGKFDAKPALWGIHGQRERRTYHYSAGAAP